VKAAVSRRQLFKAAGATALLPAMAEAQPQAPSSASSSSWPKTEGPTTPKLCLGARGDLDEAGMRGIKQIGVDRVLMGGPRIPWTEAALRERIDRFAAGGLTVCNMMISGFPNVIYGRPGRDEEIDKVQQSIRTAGKVGLPVVEYNFYAHRIVEG
jgi:mannonate dehydratase